MNAFTEIEEDAHLIERLCEQLNPLDHDIFRIRCTYTPIQECFDEIQYERRLAEDFDVYHIKTNDKLQMIATRFERDIERLAFVNNISDPKIICAGSVITLRAQL